MVDVVFQGLWLTINDLVCRIQGGGRVSQYGEGSLGGVSNDHSRPVWWGIGVSFELHSVFQISQFVLGFYGRWFIFKSFGFVSGVGFGALPPLQAQLRLRLLEVHGLQVGLLFLKFHIFDLQKEFGINGLQEEFRRGCERLMTCSFCSLNLCSRRGVHANRNQTLKIIFRLQTDRQVYQFQILSVGSSRFIRWQGILFIRQYPVEPYIYITHLILPFHDVC